MNIIYNGVDITSNVDPLVLKLRDNATGIVDSIESKFSDTLDLWSQWKPKKNDTLNIKSEGYSTGIMYIDEIMQNDGVITLKALSIPQNSKTSRSQAWENVRFLELVTEIAARYGFKVLSYNITNHLYTRVDQIDQTDFSFLNFRCMLEGYSLKISNNSIIIYDEHMEEQKQVDSKNSIIYKNDILKGFSFKDISTGIYQKCIVTSNSFNRYLQAEFEDKTIYGPIISKSIFCTSQGEADRFAKGILRSLNKYRVTGSLPTELKNVWASGINVDVRGIGLFDGKYFIDSLTHNLIKNKTQISLRKPLEGY